MTRAFAALFCALVGTLACAALACAVGTSAPRPIPVLMYHHVGDWGPSNPGWADWVVKPSAFAAQLDWLRGHGYHTITFREQVFNGNGRQMGTTTLVFEKPGAPARSADVTIAAMAAIWSSVAMWVADLSPIT